MPRKIITLEFEDGEDIPDALVAYIGDVQLPPGPTPPPPPDPDPGSGSDAIYLFGDTIAPRLWSNLQRGGGPPDAGQGLPVMVQCNDIDSLKPLKLFGSDQLLVFEARDGQPQTEPEIWATEGGHKEFWHVGNFRDEAEYRAKYFKPTASPPDHPFFVLASQVKKVSP